MYPVYTTEYYVSKGCIIPTRNPKVKKSGIRDWHLIVFVLALLLINVVVMSAHVLLEGLIARFNVTAAIPNVEMSDSVDGVS